MFETTDFSRVEFPFQPRRNDLTSYKTPSALAAWSLNFRLSDNRLLRGSGKHTKVEVETPCG